MSTSYSKGALKEMGKTAAQKYVSQDVPMNKSIEKLADKRGLNDHQIKRVSEFANHEVNAKLAEDSAYTNFELADPDEIIHSKEASFAGAYLGMVSEEGDLSKEASQEESFQETPKEEPLQLVEKIASHYGVDLNLQKVSSSRRPAFRFLKKASKVIRSIEEEARQAKHAKMDSEKKVFEEVRKALLEGIPMEQIAKDMKNKGKVGMLEKIWPRLEAEGLVDPSHYEEGGPYSEHRKLKKAERLAKEADQLSEMFDYEIAEDAPLLKQAERHKESVEKAEKEARALALIVPMAEKVASMDMAGNEKERALAVGQRLDGQIPKTAGIVSGTLNMAGKAGLKGMKGLYEGTKSLGKQFKDKSKSLGRAILGDESKSLGQKVERIGVAAGLGSGGVAGAQGVRDTLGKDTKMGV